MSLLRFYSKILILTFCLSVPTLVYSQEFKIELDLEGVNDGDIQLGFYYGKVRSFKDTVSIVDGKAVFEGDQPLPQGLYFVTTQQGSFEVFVESQFFKIKASAPDFINSMVTTSEENKGFNRLQREILKNQKLYQELSRELQFKLRQPEEAQEVRDQMRVLDIAINDFQWALVKEYQGTFLSKMITAMAKPQLGEDTPKDERGKFVDRTYQYEYYKKHFFDNIDFNEVQLLMTPIFHARMDEYMDQMTVQHPDSIKIAADYFIQKSKANSGFYRYALTSLTAKYEQTRKTWANSVFHYLSKKYFLSGDAYWLDNTFINNLKLKLDASLPKNQIGDKAPPFTLSDEVEKAVSLQDIESKYTVLFFYDPDCGHCKKSIPVLQETYARLHNQGMEVVAINTTQKEDRWKTYIEERSLNWVNLTDHEQTATFMRDYNVLSTPTIYILDADKNIIANHLHVGQLEKFLSELL